MFSADLLQRETIRDRLLLGAAVAVAATVLAGAAAVVLWLPDDYPMAPLAGGLIVLLGATSVAVFWIAEFLLRRHVLEPLAGLVNEVERVAAGDYEHRLSAEGPEEVQRVAQSVNRLADRLIRDHDLLARNIASLEETNRALTDARDRLIRAEKMASNGRLATGMAHEVGNPLQAILNYVEVGRRQGSGGEWLDGLEAEARRIDDIISSLMHFARPGSRRFHAVDLNEVVRETVELLTTQGKLEGIELGMETGKVPAIWGRAEAVKQVLVNLLLNASEALWDTGRANRPALVRDDRITVRTSIEPYDESDEPGRPAPRRADDPDAVDYSHLRRYRVTPDPGPESELAGGQEVVVVEVEDNGPGIPSDEIAHVFEPFFTTREPGRGTGLGLAISARLVREMGGGIRADSRGPGGGARFRVFLRVAPGGRGDGDDAARGTAATVSPEPEERRTP